MANDMNRNTKPVPKGSPVPQRQSRASRFANIDWSWLFWFLGFFILPSIVRIVVHFPVTWVVSSYWQLGDLSGQTQVYANRMLAFADFYGRSTISIIMLIALLFVLLYLIIGKKIDVRKWGLSFGNILPGIALFAVMWVMVYFLYVPLASAFSGANFYVGVPMPPSFEMTLPFTTYGSIPDTLQVMFMPKLSPMYAVSAKLADVYEVNLGLGLMDFVRVWFMNAPILLSMTFGYFFNTFREKVGVIKENFNWKYYGKTITAFFIAVISIPVMQALYRVVDEALSHSVDTSVAGAVAETPKIALINEPYIFVVFAVIAIIVNMLAGSSQMKERVAGKVSSSLKWVAVVLLGIITAGVLFAGEQMMSSIPYTIVSFIASSLFIVSISWLFFSPVENSTAFGFSEISKWLPGVVILLIPFATLIIMKATVGSSLLTVPVVLTVAFWLTCSIMANYIWKWLFFDPKPEKFGDWGRSLIKWLPGTIVFIIGTLLSMASGWMVTPGLYGPFTNNLGLLTALLLCGWVYIRTDNLVLMFLLYASLPWFLNFIQVQAFQTPTLVGSVTTGVFVLLAVLVLVESYRLWAPYITFEITKIVKQPEETDKILPDQTTTTPAV